MSIRSAGMPPVARGASRAPQLNVPESIGTSKKVIRVYSVLLGINLNYNNIFMTSISHRVISCLYISLDIKRVNLCLNYISALKMRLIALINACENRLTHESALNV